MGVIEQRGLGANHGGLVIGVMLVAVGLTMLATMVSVSAPQWYLVTGEAVQHEVARSSDRLVPAATADTSVPDAATALRGRDLHFEEPPATF